MSLLNVFNVTGSAMNAQTIRLNTVASNLANADTISSSPNEVYQAKRPVFATILKDEADKNSAAGVKVLDIVESEAEPLVRYEPNHPLADEKGNIYLPNIDTVEEMADMMSASRSFQNNVEVFNTSKQLLMRTLSIGR